jgi:hypothetical protein
VRGEVGGHQKLVCFSLSNQEGGEEKQLSLLFVGFQPPEEKNNKQNPASPSPLSQIGGDPKTPKKKNWGGWACSV